MTGLKDGTKRCLGKRGLVEGIFKGCEERFHNP